MSATTPSRSLPKSHHHESIAQSGQKMVSGRAALHEPWPVPAENPTFSHPQHTPPPPGYGGIEDLIIVCCHAIFHPDVSSPSFPLHSPHDERNWHLAPFQKSNQDTGKPGEHETFIAHILAGLEALKTRTSSEGKSGMLVFSGGVTKSALTPLSEARSYYNAALAEAMARGEIDGGPVKQYHDKGLILLDEHATDSYQNMLFSILLFRKTTGQYPKQVHVITHAFKSKRFLDLHARAIKWPTTRIRVQGIDPVMSQAELDDTITGEERFGYRPWLDDPLGTGEALARKRTLRGWDEKTNQELGDGLEDSVKQLLAGVIPDALPWMDSEL